MFLTSDEIRGSARILMVWPQQFDYLSRSALLMLAKRVWAGSLTELRISRPPAKVSTRLRLAGFMTLSFMGLHSYQA